MVDTLTPDSIGTHGHRCASLSVPVSCTPHNRRQLLSDSTKPSPCEPTGEGLIPYSIELRGIPQHSAYRHLLLISEALTWEIHAGDLLEQHLLFPPRTHLLDVLPLLGIPSAFVASSASYMCCFIGRSSPLSGDPSIKST